jgi:hypothetical protein
MAIPDGNTRKTASMRLAFAWLRFPDHLGKESHLANLHENLITPGNWHDPFPGSGVALVLRADCSLLGTGGLHEIEKQFLWKDDESIYELMEG